MCVYEIMQCAFFWSASFCSISQLLRSSAFWGYSHFAHPSSCSWTLNSFQFFTISEHSSMVALWSSSCMQLTKFFGSNTHTHIYRTILDYSLANTPIFFDSKQKSQNFLIHIIAITRSIILRTLFIWVKIFDDSIPSG
jgi:hypothetical protein